MTVHDRFSGLLCNMYSRFPLIWYPQDQRGAGLSNIPVL